MYRILTPQHSFIRFDGAYTFTHCLHGEVTECLPVYEEADIAFQFVVEADSEAEADALCDPYTSGIEMGLVFICGGDGPFVHEFVNVPDRFRISTTQVLYNWQHGAEGMVGNVDIGQCFYIQVIVNGVRVCSNCFQRIPDPCFTSVVEYGNEENFAGFNYCNAGGIESGESTSCDPEVYSFTNQDTVVVPYTASLIDRFGEVPTVQAWIYDEFGQLTNMGIVATFDAMPPTSITFNMGGTASGIIIIR